MYVGLKMLKDFVTVSPSTLVKEADRLLEEKKLWMLLVVEDDKLVGYVRKEDIRGALPSMVSSLEKHEANYLMAKLTVKEITRKDITTVPPETEIEAAADLMCEMNLAGLAVVDHENRLIGYINRSVMLEVLVEEMGHREGGSRIVVQTEDRTGVIYEVAGIISNMKKNIISTGTFNHGNSKLLVVRGHTDDASPIAAALQERGYRVMGPMDFMAEWA